MVTSWLTLFGRVGSSSTPSDTYQFSLPYTGWFLLVWSCSEETTVQRLFKYKKHRIRHFFRIHHEEISDFFSVSSLARLFTSVKGHCVKLFQYRSSFRDGFSGWQWSGRRRKCGRFWRTGVKLFCSFASRKFFGRFSSTLAAVWQVFTASGGGILSHFSDKV